MRRSRDSWKGRALSIALSSSESSGKPKRGSRQGRIGLLIERITVLEQALLYEEKSKSQSGEIFSIDEATQTRLVCIFLVAQALVSFRAVPRILELLHEMEQLSLRWVPHFTLVINWAVRTGLAALN